MSRLPAAQRRDALISATTALFLAKGIAATTTRDVTASLGVGAGLLSHYFPWAELRASAFEAIVRADVDRSLSGRADEPADAILSDLLRDAFDIDGDHVWRCWIEACDLAASDSVLAEAVARCTEIWQRSLLDLLQRGEREGHWRCVDAVGASWRMIALLDGLVGLVMAPHARLGREAASRYLATAVDHECAGFRAG